MEKEDLSVLLRQHPFLVGLSDEHMQNLIGCASNVRFAEGAYIIKEGQVANSFYLIRSGRVATEIDVPGREAIRVQTVGPGEILGWSWLVSPYRWHFGGIAVVDTRAIALDGECLRNKCAKDPHFGYEMLRRLAEVMQSHLEATILQLLDMYTEIPDGARQ
jgi:CRP/FNR family transcriptional regulator, cyclic AMP receptor protein